MARTLRLALALALALPLAARAADPAPAPAPTGEAAKPTLAPALQEKLDVLQKDLTALQEAAKAPDVPEAQRTMVDRHVGHMQQMVTMMQSGGCPCCGGDPSKCPMAKNCPMARGGKCPADCPADCPMLKGGKCPAGCPMMHGQGPGPGRGKRRAK